MNVSVGGRRYNAGHTKKTKEKQGGMTEKEVLKYAISCLILFEDTGMHKVIQIERHPAKFQIYVSK